MKDRTDRKTLPEALPAEQKEKNNRVKWYGVVWGIGLLIFQHSMYLLANVIAGWIGIPPFLPKIEAIDDLIPLVPVFVLPYIWSYFFWAMAPMAVSKCEKRYFYNFITAYICSCLFGMLIFIFAPSYMDRAGRTSPSWREIRFSGICCALCTGWTAARSPTISFRVFTAC